MGRLWSVPYVDLQLIFNRLAAEINGEDLMKSQSHSHRLIDWSTRPSMEPSQLAGEPSCSAHRLTWWDLVRPRPSWKPCAMPFTMLVQRHRLDRLNHESSKLPAPISHFGTGHIAEFLVKLGRVYGTGFTTVGVFPIHSHSNKYVFG